MGKRMQLADEDLVTLTGEVVEARVVGADFYTVARVIEARGDGRAHAVVGRLFGVQVGDTVELRGTWEQHDRHGRQFRVRSHDTVLAQDTSGVVRWISERLPDVGRSRAVALVERFGVPGIWNVIEREPARLAEVDGITPARAAAIAEAYALVRGERERMVWFKQLGLTDGQIRHVLAEWGKDAEARLRANPFALCEHVHGFGFKRADEVARKMGLPATAPGRLREGLRYVLREARQQGHVYVRTGALVGTAAGDGVLGGVDEQLVWAELGALVRAGELVARGKGEKGGGRVYLAVLDQAEEKFAAFVRRAA